MADYKDTISASTCISDNMKTFADYTIASLKDTLFEDHLRRDIFGEVDTKPIDVACDGPLKFKHLVRLYPPSVTYSKYVGQKFGELIIKEELDTRGSNFRILCICECSCNRCKAIPLYNLLTHSVMSCGQCGYHARRIKETLGHDLTGKKFGYLIVLGRSDDVFDYRGKLKWQCFCTRCGNIVDVSSGRLTAGDISTCGNCGYQQEKAAAIGRSCRKYFSDDDSELIRKYYGMKQRCYCPTHSKYPMYGARGVVICDEWLKDPFNFINWAKENGWKRGLTIERINDPPYKENQDGPYAPWNCRFVTFAEQANNRRNNHWFDVYGKFYTLSQCSRILGISTFRLSHMDETKVVEMMSAKLHDGGSLA